MEIKAEEPLHDAEKILDERPGPEYLIVWAGRDEHGNAWEPSWGTGVTPALLAAWNEDKKLASSVKVEIKEEERDTKEYLRLAVKREDGSEPSDALFGTPLPPNETSQVKVDEDVKPDIFGAKSISSLPPELLRRILGLSLSTTSELLDLALVARTWAPPAQKLLSRDVWFHPNLPTECKSYYGDGQPVRGYGTRAKSVKKWLRAPARFTRCVDLAGVKDNDVDAVLSRCTGTKEIWNLDLYGSTARLALPALEVVTSLGLVVRTMESNLVVPPRPLVHLRFEGDLAEKNVMRLLARLLLASAATLQHLDLMAATWTAENRVKLFKILVDRGIAPRLLSLGLPFARPSQPEEDDNPLRGWDDDDREYSDNDGEDAAQDKLETDSDTSEQEVARYLSSAREIASVEEDAATSADEANSGWDEYEDEYSHDLPEAESAFIIKCTFLRTLGCFRLPDVERCPATVDTILMWFRNIPTMGSPFEYHLEALRPQLRRMRLLTVGALDNFADEQDEPWLVELLEAGVDLILDDRAHELRFGF